MANPAFKMSVATSIPYLSHKKREDLEGKTRIRSAWKIFGKLPLNRSPRRAVHDFQSIIIVQFIISYNHTNNAYNI